MKNRVAFTLPQLLVSISVVSLLAVAILPVLQSDHATLQRAICANNLREIGQAIAMYANDNNDFFPPGYQQTIGSDWHLIIGPYLAKSQTTYASGGTKSPVFICPAAATPPAGSTTSLTYTAHRTLFWPIPSATASGICGPYTLLPYRMSQATRPGEVVMVFDACLSQTSGVTFDAQACSDALGDTTTWVTCAGAQGTNDKAVSIGQNTDGANAGLIRWRHNNNNGANFLFVDGHVESLVVGQLLHRNLRFDMTVTQ